MGYTIGMNVLKKEKSLAAAEIATPDRPARSPVNIPTTLSRLLESSKSRF